MKTSKPMACCSQPLVVLTGPQPQAPDPQRCRSPGWLRTAAGSPDATVVVREVAVKPSWHSLLVWHTQAFFVQFKLRSRARCCAHAGVAAVASLDALPWCALPWFRALDDGPAAGALSRLAALARDGHPVVAGVVGHPWHGTTVFFLAGGCVLAGPLEQIIPISAQSVGGSPGAVMHSPLVGSPLAPRRRAPRPHHSWPLCSRRGHLRRGLPRHTGRRRR